MKNPTVNNRDSDTGSVPAILQGKLGSDGRIRVIKRRGDLAVWRDVENVGIFGETGKGAGGQREGRALDQVQSGSESAPELIDPSKLLGPRRGRELNDHINDRQRVNTLEIWGYLRRLGKADKRDKQERQSCASQAQTIHLKPPDEIFGGSPVDH